MTQTEHAAILSRSRRSTAGKRMSSLVGKALEDDDQFWSHSTWKEEKGSDDSSSDDGSYNVDDEAEENRVDVFDSDFDESESEEEEGEDEEEERRAIEEDRIFKKKGQYIEPKRIEKAGRDLLRKKKGKKGKAVGSGANAGLVLNLPTHFGQDKSTEAEGDLISRDGSSIATSTITADQSAQKRPPSSPVKKLTPSPTLASTRSRRSSSSKFATQRNLRAATKEKTCEAHQNYVEAERDSARRSKILSQSKKKAKNKRKYTQEELLIEAANVTEADNERWILSRKRVQAIVEEKKKMEGAKKDFKVAMKFHSRKGCFNTLTFPDMDLVPEILRKSEKPRKRKANEICVITGKKARYRDPLTGKPYFGKEAFCELRRRHENGEPLKQAKSIEKKPSERSKQHVRVPSSQSNPGDEQLRIQSNANMNKMGQSNSSIEETSVQSSPNLKQLSVQSNPTAKQQSLPLNQDAKQPSVQLSLNANQLVTQSNPNVIPSSVQSNPSIHPPALQSNPNVNQFSIQSDPSIRNSLQLPVKNEEETLNTSMTKHPSMLLSTDILSTAAALAANSPHLLKSSHISKTEHHNDLSPGINSTVISADVNAEVVPSSVLSMDEVQKIAATTIPINSNGKSHQTQITVPQYGHIDKSTNPPPQKKRKSMNTTTKQPAVMNIVSTVNLTCPPVEQMIQHHGSPHTSQSPTDHVPQSNPKVISPVTPPQQEKTINASSKVATDPTAGKAPSSSSSGATSHLPTQHRVVRAS